MAEGDPLAPDDWATRYCKPSQVADGEVTAPAFQLDPGHAELSMTWLGCLGDGSRTELLGRARDAMIAGRLNVKPNGWLATIRVGAVTGLTNVADMELALAVLHMPDGNPCHCGITGLPPPDSDFSAVVGLELASLTDGPPVRVRDLAD